jgi:hypothetical protein
MARRAARQHKPKPAKRTSRQHNERGSPKPSPWVLLQDAYQRLRAYLEPSDLPRLTAAMKDDIANQKLSLDELKAMPDKTLEDRYSAKRERIKAALLAVADELKK